MRIARERLIHLTVNTAARASRPDRFLDLAFELIHPGKPIVEIYPRFDSLEARSPIDLRGASATRS